jgi:ParB-like chromosome segregation protein Spo0J
MSGKVISEETIRFTQVELKQEIILVIRHEIDPSIAMRYLEKYENGVELPPLDVQKGTYLLINGYHRYQALKSLGREQVKVRIWDVNDEDLIYLAYRLNDEQGQAVNSNVRNTLIWRARYSDKKSEKEIGQIFRMTESRVSQILSQIEYSLRETGTLDKLNELNAKEIKVDLREKVSKREVLEKINEGLPQNEIAKEFKITEGRVSQIKKEDADWHKSAAVTFTLEKLYLKQIINTVLLNGLFHSGFIQFWSDHIDIRNFSEEFKVIARFSKEFFLNYNVNQEGFKGYVEKEMIEGIDKLRIDRIDVSFKEQNPFSQTTLFRDAYENERGVITSQKDNIEPQDDSLPYFNLDNFNPDVSVKVLVENFPRHETGTLGLEVKDDKMILDFNCKHGFHCNQTIDIISYAEGKRGEAKAHCDFGVLDTILCDRNENLIRGDFWMHFWRDREHIAINPNPISTRSRFVPRNEVNIKSILIFL